MPESPPAPRRAATCTPAFLPAPVPQPYFWLARAWGSWLRLSLPAALATKKNNPEHGKTNPHHRPALHLGPRGRNVGRQRTRNGLVEGICVPVAVREQVARGAQVPVEIS